MYTGKLIDELIERVQRAEEDARIYRDEELIQQFLETHMLDASYITNHVGVA
jgi:dihydrofolate reductase